MPHHSNLPTIRDINHRHLLDKITCDQKRLECFLGECQQCPDPDSFKQDLLADFDEEAIDSVTYQQWISTDRTTLETIVKGVEEFCDTLMDKLVHLKKHDYIAKEQSSFLKNKKKSLQPGELIIICEFAENYSFVL